MGEPIAAAAAQSAVGRRIRLIVGVIAAIHGIIHLLAPADMWGWAELDDEIRPTLSIGSGVEQTLAYAWVIAAVVVVTAATLLLRRRAAWRWFAIVGVALSQVLIVIWWNAASAGTVANLIIVGGLVFDRRVGLTAPAPAAKPFGPCCEGWEESEAASAS
jgi:hypothetical protein